MIFHSKASFSLVLLLSAFVQSCATTGIKTLSPTQRAKLIVQVANGALLEGDPTGALQHLAKAEESDPNLPELHHTKALAYHAKHDDIRAIAEARLAVSIQPAYSEANNTLGKLLLDQGRYDEAEKPLMVAATNPLYRDSYRAYTNLGILYYRKEDDKKSEDALSKAIQESPTLSCIAYYYMGHIHLKNGSVLTALGDYEKASQKFCAGFADAHLAVGVLYEKNKDYEHARKKFLDIKQSFPNTKIAEQAMEHLKYIP